MKQIYLWLFAILTVWQTQAQVDTKYTFSQSSGTYVSITGGTVLASGSALNSAGYTVTLPTPFTFNGVSITDLRVNDDGYLALGVTSFANSTAPIASENVAIGIVAGLAMNLVSSTVSGAAPEIRWEQVGNEYIFQWTDMARSAQAATEIFDFQIHIDRTTDVISLVYNDFSTVTTSTSFTPQVGLRGATNTDFNSRRLTSGIPDSTPSWDGTTYGINNNHTVRFLNTCYPALGQTYTYTPAVCNVISSYPWTENFDALATYQYPTCWYKESGDWAQVPNSDSTNDADARSGTNFLREAYSATNEYMWSPLFQLTAGVSYDYTFWWAGDNYATWDATLHYNNIQSSVGASAFTTPIVVPATTTTKTYQKYTATFVPTTTGTYSFGFKVSAPSTPWYLSFDDFKMQPTPIDTVDWANLQAIVGGATPGVVSTINACQTVQVYSQVWEPTYTEDDVVDPGMQVWIGKSTADTDPATWAESAWTLATFNTTFDVGADTNDNDEYFANMSGMTLGTYYFASRYSLNDGPYRYGATNNGFWDATHPNAMLTVTDNPTFSVSASNATVCSGISSDLSATSANANFTYSWDNGAGTGAMVTVSPATTTTYTCTATDSVSGCTFTQTVTVTVNPLPTAATALATPSTVCLGGVSEIVATGYESSANGKIGSGTATNTTSTPYKAWFGSQKMQALYTAAELTALGLTAGSEISSLGFVALSGTPLQMNDFTVDAGFVTTSVLSTTTFDAGATTNVFTNAAYTPASGTGNIDYALSTPLIWDGTSNLLVQTCFNNNNDGGSSSNNISVESSTVATGLNIYQSKDSAADACSVVYSIISSTNRPNLRVTYSVNNNVTWSPVAGLYTDATATTAYVAATTAYTVYAKPTTAGTSTYTLTTTNAASCSATSTVDVIVNALPTTPSGTTPQVFCASTNPTVASLVVTGDADLVWYDAATAGNVLPTSTALVNGTSYFVSSKNASTSCESARFEVVATVNATPVAPTGTATQEFCSTDGDDLGDLVVTTVGTVKWYDMATAGTELPLTTLLVDGVTYYAADVVSGCESATRLAVTADENCPFTGCLTAPNGQWPSSTYTPTTCDGATVNNITTIGWTGEYSKMNVTNGQHYVFSSSVTTDAITIADTDGTIVYAAGIGSVTWDSTFDGVIRFYTHLAADCTYSNTSRTRRVVCGTPPTTAPDCPVIVAPVDGSTGLGTTVAISWTAATTGEPSSSYNVYLDIVDGTTLVGNVTGTSANFINLVPGTTYYWTVAGVNAAGASSGCTVQNFTVATSPANDLCTGATPLTVGANFASSAVAGSILAATTTAGVTPSCQSSFSADVWYTVVVPSSGNVTIESQASTSNSMTDSVIAVFSGDCGTLVQVACDDDSGTGFMSLTTVTGQTPGTILYVAIWKFGTTSSTDATSNFQIAAYDCASMVSLPTAAAIQYICATSQFNTLADLNVTVSGTEVWYNAATAGNPLPSTTIMVAGTTYYVANQDLGCESIRVAVTVVEDCNLGVDDIIYNVKMYPNPTSDYLNIVTDQNIKNVEVINYLGQTLKVSNINNQKLDVTQLPIGTYIVRFTFDNGNQAIEQFIKK